MTQRRNLLLLCGLSALVPGAGVGAGEPCLIDSIDEPEGFVKFPALREDVLLVPRLEGDPPEWNRVTVYRRSGGQWLTEAVLEPLNEENVYGSARALGDGVLVIGDHYFPVDQPLSGAAFVYRYGGDEHDSVDQWRLEATLTAPETDPLPHPSRVANAVAIDDEIVIAGAPGHDVDDAVHAGAAFVFRNGPDGWEYETMLSSPEPAEWGGIRLGRCAEERRRDHRRSWNGRSRAKHGAGLRVPRHRRRMAV